MMRTPAVSIVLPVHNGAVTLERALASIHAQTLEAWELLIVDDGSTDASAEIATNWARRDSRVRVLSPGRVGLAAALNTGLAAARGALIARMDADDESHPERLAAQAGFLGTHAGIGLVACRVDFGGDRGANGGYALHVDWLNGLLTPAEIALNRFVESPLAHPSVMFRRELVDAHGGYRTGDFPEDYELWLRWLEAGVLMAKLPETLLTWHDAPTRLSRTDPRYDTEAFFRVKAEYLARRLRGEGRGRGSRPVWVWGAGRPTRRRAAHLESHGVKVSGYVDIDPRKTGRSIGGVPVVSPAELPPAGDAFVLGYVASRGARELIRTALAGRGAEEGRDFLMCA